MSVSFDFSDEEREELKSAMNYESLQDEYDPFEVEWKDLEGDAKEAHLQVLRKRVEAMQASRLAFLNFLISKRPKEFIRCACHAVLDDDDADWNPLALKDSRDPDKYGKTKTYLRNRYSEMASTYLLKLDSEERGDPKLNTDYLLIKDWIVPRINNAHTHFQLTQTDTEELLDAFFSRHESEFSYGSMWACELAYHGVPFYELLPTGTFSRLAFNNEDYVYISKKGEHCDNEDRSQFPYWTKKYYFAQKDLDAYKIFFSGDIYDKSKEAVAALRDAYHKYLGITPGLSSARMEVPIPGTNRLLGVVREILETYDSAATWPKQEALVRDLMDRKKLTNREAQAVDLVTRPDHLRGKKRMEP